VSEWFSDVYMVYVQDLAAALMAKLASTEEELNSLRYVCE
jgi:hypothetical protein